MRIDKEGISLIRELMFRGAPICKEAEETLDKLEAVLKKQDPMEAVWNFETGGAVVFYDCPACGGIEAAGANFYGQPNPCDIRNNYCKDCGQKIKWEEKK